MAETAEAAEAPPAGTGPACDQCRSRKVRCDRRRPECSNCIKAGACCDFSAQNRRPNPTKQLLSDVSQVTARLDSIEAAIAGFQRDFKSFAGRPPPLAPAQPSPSTLDIRHLLDRRRSADGTELDPASAAADISAAPIHHGDDGCGGEQFYGPTAPLSLFKAAHERLSDALQPGHGPRPLLNALANSPAALDALRAKNDAFPFLEERHTHWPRGDTEPVAVPPRTFLDACIDVFLDEVNVYMPVFDPARLREVMDAHYAEPEQPGDTREAWNLCFNNIILLAMCLSSRLNRNRQVASQGMEHDILQFFLRNATRCLLDLDRFSTQSLANLQALTTLALVVREYHEGHVFAKLLPRICQLARNMGLQQSHAYGGLDDSTAVNSERKNLFWTLYRLDKQRCIMSGQPCDLYLFDSDIRYGGCSGVALAMQPYTVASIYVMSLWEDIYLSLYSPRAVRRGHAYRNEQARSHDASLQSWYTQNKELLESSSVDDPSPAVFFRYELKYCFHVGKILVNRSGSGAADKHRCIENAKAALQIIEEVWKLGSTPSAVALLGRLFRCYPMVAFTELCCNILENPDTSDASLLTSTFQVLDTLVHPHFPRVYYARLKTGMAWCLDVVELMQGALQNLTPGRDGGSSSGSSGSPSDSIGHTRPTSPSDCIDFSSGKRKAGTIQRVNDYGSGNSDQPHAVRRKTSRTSEAQQHWSPTVLHSSVFKDLMAAVNCIPMRPAQSSQSMNDAGLLLGIGGLEDYNGPSTVAKSPFDVSEMPDKDFAWDNLWSMDVSRLEDYDQLPQDWDYTFS